MRQTWITGHAVSRIITSFCKPGTHEPLFYGLEVALVAVLIIPDRHRHLLQGPTARSAIVKSPPAQHRPHEAFQVARRVLSFRQTYRSDVVVVIDPLFQGNDADVIEEAVPSKVRMLDDGRDGEFTGSSIVIRPVQVMVSQSDSHML